MANKNGFYQGLIELFYPKENPMIARPPLENLAHSTRWIRETLKIVPRTGPKIEGDFNIRFNRLIERMILFNKGTFAELSKYGKRFMEDIKRGKSIHKQSIDNIEFEMAVITDTGFPVTFRVDNPTLLTVVGALSWTNNKTRQFNADISVTYASNLQAELSFYTPFDSTQHVAAHYSQRIVKPPATRLHAGLNSQGDGLVISLWPLKAIDKPLSIYKEINKPFTAQRDVNHYSTSGLSKNSHDVHGTYVIDKEDTSMPLKLTVHRDIYDSTKMRLDSTRPFSIFALPSVWPDLAASTIEYTLGNYYPTTLEIGMGRSYTRGGEVRMVKPQQMNGFRNLTNDPNSSIDTTTSSTTESSTVTYTSPSDTTTTETTPYNENITSTYTPTPSSTMSTTMSTPTSATFPTTMPTTMHNAPTPATISTPEEAYNAMIAPGSEEVIRFCKWAQQPQNGNFNATTMNLAEINDNHERIHYLLRSILDGIECGNAFAGGMMATFDTPEPKKYGVYWGIGNEISKRVHRVGLFLITPDEEKSNYGMTATLSSSPMPVLYLSDILRSNINSNLYADVVIPGKDAFTIKGYMLRSAPKPSFYDTEPVRGLLENHYSLIPESRQIARDYTTLDVYNFTFFTNENHQVGNSYPVRMLKRLYYPLITEEPATGVNIGGRANIAVTVCPERDCMDALMRLPGINVRFDQIPVNPTLFSLFQVNPAFGPMSSLVDPSFCSLELGNIVTFDGKKFGWNDYDSRQCWHVLAKDCSGASRIAILARIYNNYTEVEVNLDNYRVLRLKNGPTAEVNGETIAMSEDLVAEVSDLKNATLMVISKSKDQAIEVSMPAHGFYLIYGDDRVMVEASRIHQGRLCGLCGDYDGEKVNDFRKAGGDVVASSNEFSLSYAFLRTCERNNHTQ
ncbi:hypothetical protein J437_LFUL009524 [Ladona fulva]|uniref:VWFD domain-containing protein n=1 Tax=Ladona fulva TaxID=123851 RepID=A0A8K0P1I7_LADFU|nr:hypothetical protein J437_LFUL009524 [Ladona fulva]